VLAERLPLLGEPGELLRHGCAPGLDGLAVRPRGVEGALQGGGFRLRLLQPTPQARGFSLQLGHAPLEVADLRQGGPVLGLGAGAVRLGGLEPGAALLQLCLESSYSLSELGGFSPGAFGI